MSKGKISLREILIGIIGGFVSYIIIAILNISNEDIHNWDVNTIFSDGGIEDISALLLLGVWLLTMTIWILTLLLRIIKQIR